MRANVYIDGFNLYYGIKRWPGSKWLNIGDLCTTLFPNDQINRIRYFTAHVKGRPDPGAPRRQQTFIRALGTVPNLSIHYGSFLVTYPRMALAQPPHGTVQVIKTEEKGSDVNLGAYLLLDVFRGDCDMAVVISNDSDLSTPIDMVQAPPFNVPVWVVNPHVRRTNKLTPTHYLDLKRAVVLACQFPPQVMLPKGKMVTRPAAW